MLFLKAIFIGSLISLPTGPVGFLCVRRTLISGPKAGMYSVLGAVISDIFYVSIVSFGLSHISSHILIYRIPLRIIASGLLIFIALKGLKKEIPEGALTISDYNPLSESISTFFLNITNPILIITYGFLFSSFGIHISPRDNHSLVIFVAGIVLGSVIFWFLFTRLISYVHKKYLPLDLEKINRVTSYIILGTGVLLLVSIFA